MLRSPFQNLGTAFNAFEGVKALAAFVVSHATRAGFRYRRFVITAGRTGDYKKEPWRHFARFDIDILVANGLHLAAMVAPLTPPACKKLSPLDLAGHQFAPNALRSPLRDYGRPLAFAPATLETLHLFHLRAALL